MRQQRKKGLKANLTIATNGVMNEKQLDWLIAWFDSVNVSFDGLEELQNKQRPMCDGTGSFPYVHRTLKRLNDAGKEFGIRSTLTSSSIEKLPEIALFVLENYPHCDPLHVEPAWEAGRSLITGERTPDADLFIKKSWKRMNF
jgi:Arylsulfatase regulator (Fe-S oxidoreductase)